MPTRKQRRRKQKSQRHEYEYVYVDDDGHEVEAPPDAEEAPKAKAKTPAAQGKGQQRTRRPPREPNLKRSAVFAVGFAGVLFVITGMGKHAAAPGSRIFVALIYGLAFFLFMTFVERRVYRSYLKRSGQLPAKADRPAKPVDGAGGAKRFLRRR